MKVDIYTVGELMEINDSLMEYLGDEQGYKVVANLMAAGDRCKEAVEALENCGNGLYDALAAADINIDDANWTKLIASWIVSYVVEAEDVVEKYQAWN